ncbi:MAG TPA: glycosyltransferase family 39 protein [Solirubrobacteraceae bacterium]|nr:glycosyltransferase family 39 protein [Solirubrobacteraceae bacterium]
MPTRFETLEREAGRLRGRHATDAGGPRRSGRAPDAGDREPSAPPQTPHRVRRTSVSALTTVTRREALAWLATLSVLYVALGCWLVLHANLIVGDALSRVASAQFVIGSRDPHLAAVGFIWPPLLSFMEIPLVELRPLWPALASRGMASVVLSALFTAAAAIEILRIVRRQTGRPAMARAAALAFALNPLILFYAANGMSEASFVYFALRGSRALLRWAHTDDTGALVLAGLAFALGYLIRYEALVAATGAMLVVLAIDLRWGRQASLRARAAQIAIDVGTLMLPVVLAFLGWAFYSWLITGQPFAQFTDVYGNSSIIRLESAGQAASSSSKQIFRAGIDVWLLCCSAPFAIAWCAHAMRRRTDPLELSVALPGSAVLAFAAYDIATGGQSPFLRYLIVAVPLCVLLVAVRPMHPLIAAVGLGAPLLTAWLAISSPAIGTQEHYLPASLHTSTATKEEVMYLHQFKAERRLAAAIDALHLGRGRVLVDALFGYPVVLASHDPRQFVITTDRDFAQALAQPWESGVRYLIAVAPIRRGLSDALNVRYPGIYATGGGIADFMLQADSDSADPSLRLYRVLSPDQLHNGLHLRPPSRMAVPGTPTVVAPRARHRATPLAQLLGAVTTHPARRVHSG